jgi:hypothetical protein
MAANLFGLVLFVIGCVLIVVNTLAVHKTHQNRRRGIDKHVSGIAFIPQLLMIFAALSFHAAKQPWLPTWLPLAIGVADPGLLRLLYLTLKAVRDRPRKKPE